MKENINSYYAKSKSQPSDKRYLITISNKYTTQYLTFMRQMERQLQEAKGVSR